MGAILDEHAVESDWGARGFSYGVWVDPPGQIWADFVHGADELVMLVEGALEVRFRGCTIRPAAGAEVLIPAGTRHTVRNVGTTPNGWLYGYRKAD